MNKIINIGDLSFSTQKEAVEFFRKILNKYKPKEVLNNNDFEFVFNLLKRHPKSKEKIGGGVEEITIDIFKYNKRCFFVKRFNENKERFSYLKCIKGKEKPFARFCSACRKEIQADLKKVKDDYFKIHSKKGKVKCQETNEETAYIDLHVDHRQPNTFSVIADRFIELKTIEIDKIKYDRAEDYGHIFSDRKLAEEFRNYHKEKAKLRLVKKSLNLGRSFQARIHKQKKDLQIKN